MKKLLVFGFVMNLFIIGYSQGSNVAAGGSCSCPGGWATCSANCWFSDCCICYNPQTSEGGCGCWFGVGFCKSARIGADKTAFSPSSDDAKISFSFERFNELLVWLSSQKIDISRLSKDYQSVQSKYLGQKGKVPVPVADYNIIAGTYNSFIESLTVDQKNLVRSYIDNKEKTK